MHDSFRGFNVGLRFTTNEEVNACKTMKELLEMLTLCVHQCHAL